MPDVFEGLAKTLAAVVPEVPMYQAPQWADPKIWLITAAVLVVITLVAIYMRFEGGQK
ncbi:MAG: hypothetical protein ABIA12_02290 [Candidatus Aenigmatarchaeota archaeon]